MRNLHIACGEEREGMERRRKKKQIEEKASSLHAEKSSKPLVSSEPAATFFSSIQCSLQKTGGVFLLLGFHKKKTRDPGTSQQEKKAY